jgi:hypothetical protein
MSQLASGSGDKRHALKVRKDDLYQTPPEAVTALLRAENLPEVVWEPACGPGSIVRVLRESGRQVYATDLVDYDSPDQDCAGWDFLMEKQVPIGVEAIITNPPFKNAADFVRKGLELCPLVIMLMRLAFLEGVGRSDILDGGSLARVHVFKNRLPLMHREGWTGNVSTNTIAFAWFVFNRSHTGPTEIHRIAWRREVDSCSDSDL